jgi:hypothetical protein
VVRSRLRCPLRTWNSAKDDTPDRPTSIAFIFWRSFILCSRRLYGTSFTVLPSCGIHNGVISGFIRLNRRFRVRSVRSVVFVLSLCQIAWDTFKIVPPSHFWGSVSCPRRLLLCIYVSFSISHSITLLLPMSLSHGI